MRKISYLLFLVMLWGCNSDSETGKYQNKWDNVIHVREKVKEINTEDVLISSLVRLCMVYDYLIIRDHNSNNEFIHIFDRNNLIT
jgi:hypothetical protein